jgi:D-lyxose ketol-isomerase
MIFEFLPGDMLRLRPNTPHRFWVTKGTEPAVFIEFSTHDDPEDSYRLEESRKRN